MKVLKRDHHLGQEPVAHINRIPQKLVMHLRISLPSLSLRRDVHPFRSVIT